MIAVLVHLPVPMFSFLRLARRAIAMRDATQPLDEPDKKAPEPPSVPIELVEMPKTEPAKDGEAWGAPVKGKAPPAAAEKTEVKLGAGKETDKEEKDDGDKADDGNGGKKKSKGKDDKKAKRDQGKTAEKEELGMKGAKDALAGKPNVMLAMWLGSLRDHPMADAAEKLFSCAPEWKPFVAEGVRPLVDIEGVMVMGPKLNDGSKMTAAVQHHIPKEKTKEITRSLVEKSGASGGSIEDGVARILLMRHERAVFEHPTDMLFLTPIDGYKPIFRSKEPLSLPGANGRALSLTLQKPARAVAKLGVKIPERMKELKIDVFANPDGSADLQLDFEDTTPETAQAAQKPVSDAVSGLFLDLGRGAAIAKAFGEDAIADAVKLPQVSFDAVETRLTATAHFDALQTKKMLAVLSLVVCPKKRK